MSYSITAPEQLQTLMNVTADSLATYCGLLGGENHTDDSRMVMLKQQLGILQAKPSSQQQRIHSEFAAKYLPSLTLAFRGNSHPLNSSVTMLNVISYTPYFVRFQRTPAGHGLAVLQANRMATAPASTHFNIDHVGEITQFLSTLMILQGTEEITEEDKKALLQKLNQWKRTYKGTGRMAESGSERCKTLLTSNTNIPEEFYQVKTQIERVIEQCGVQGCPRRKQGSGPDLMQCARCKTTLYCGTEHQKRAWPSHKSTCFTPTF